MPVLVQTQEPAKFKLVPEVNTELVLIAHSAWERPDPGARLLLRGGVLILLALCSCSRVLRSVPGPMVVHSLDERLLVASAWFVNSTGFFAFLAEGVSGIRQSTVQELFEALYYLLMIAAKCLLVSLVPEKQQQG